MIKLKVDPDILKRHAEFYGQGLVKGLAFLANGHKLRFRKRNGKSARFSKKSIGPVKGCGLCYVFLVQKLFKEANLLSRDVRSLRKCVKQLKNFDDILRKRFPSSSSSGAKKKKNKAIRNYEQALVQVRSLFNYRKFGAGLYPRFDSEVRHNGCFVWERLDDWSAWHYLVSLGAENCSYCNTDGVFALRIDESLSGTKKTTVDICDAEEEGDRGEPDGKILYKRSPFDHYFAHSKYPCLGLSLCNLIPSCTRCNTNMKGAKEQDPKKHVHPFRDSFDDGIRFYAIFEDYAALVFPKDGKVSVVLRPPIKEKTSPSLVRRAAESAKFFHLEDVYNQTYRREVTDVVRRMIVLPDSYWEDLYRRYPGIEDAQVNQTIMSCSLDRGKINQERFSKLTCDLKDQLRMDSNYNCLRNRIRDDSALFEEVLHNVKSLAKDMA